MRSFDAQGVQERHFGGGRSPFPSCCRDDLAAALDRIAELEAANDRLRAVLAEIHLLAVGATEKYEPLRRRRVDRIYALSSPLAAAEGARLAAERGLAGEGT